MQDRKEVKFTVNDMKLSKEKWKLRRWKHFLPEGPLQQCRRSPSEMQSFFTFLSPRIIQTPQKWAGRYLEAQTCSQAHPHVENSLQCLLKLQRLLNTGLPAINDIDILQLLRRGRAGEWFGLPELLETHTPLSIYLLKSSEVNLRLGAGQSFVKLTQAGVMQDKRTSIEEMSSDCR